jgi:hypothetical protein
MPAGWVRDLFRDLHTAARFPWSRETLNLGVGLASSAIVNNEAAFASSLGKRPGLVLLLSLKSVNPIQAPACSDSAITSS